VARKLLHLKAGIEFTAFVRQIHNLALAENYFEENQPTRDQIESNIVRCPDKKMAGHMIALIQDTAREHETIGGIIELVITGVPAGLGNPVFDRLDSLLTGALMGIPAVKGVEIGSGFKSATMKGTEHNDLFYNDNGKIRTRSNFSGGIQAGISNGERIIAKIAFKPTATTGKEQMTVNKEGKELTLKVHGRHDPCVVPRAVPIVEACAAVVIADLFLMSKTDRFDQL
jgi:chorismate synthase